MANFGIANATPEQRAEWAAKSKAARAAKTKVAKADGLNASGGYVRVEVLLRDGVKIAKLNRPRAIAMKCFQCSNCQWSEVYNCEIKTCALWNFRPRGKPNQHQDHEQGGQEDAATGLGAIAGDVEAEAAQ